jgi:SAM-dependent methyltransferase
MVSGEPSGGPRLYRDLAEWYPLLTPVGDYAEEAAFYRRLFDEHCRRPPRTLLDLGCGGGHNAAHLKATLTCTLVDVAPAMLAVSRRLNRECEHVEGDMRAVRLGRAFDCVLVHDAVSYMTTRADLAATMATAFEHTAPGGVALCHPDCTTETFRPGTDTGGSDGGGRHTMGLFPRAHWLEQIAAAGFQPLAVPFEHSEFADTDHEVFVGLRPDGGAGT